MYAVVETGGKQYRMAPGDVLRVEKIGEPGEEILFEQVLLLVRDDGTVAVGNPFVDGAKVRAKVAGHGKARKILVFKYKPKKNYRRRQGHRQYLSRVLIDRIELSAATS